MIHKAFGTVGILVGACALLALVGCEDSNQGEKSSLWQALTEDEAIGDYYPWPDDLAGDPTQTGLLMIEASMKQPLLKIDFEGAAIVNAISPKKAVFSGSFFMGGFWSEVFGKSSGTAVFANLSPGRYRIQKLKFSRSGQWIVVWPPQIKEFTVEVKAGEVSYVGRVLASTSFRSTRVKLGLKRNRQREAEAWKNVLEKYRGSPWTPIIEEHVISLPNSGDRNSGDSMPNKVRATRHLMGFE